MHLSEGKAQSFDWVVVTTSKRTMQIVHRLTGDETFFIHDVSRAVNEMHPTGSSKLFMLTKNKFWLRDNLPVTILNDGLALGVYCLDDEPDKLDGPGVVLLSYTWEDDAHKLLAFSDKKQLCKYLVHNLSAIFSEFTVLLVPIDDDYDRHVLHYDWLTDPHTTGAFKLNYPGQDIYSQRLFFQFQKANCSDKDKGMYLAGCDCSFTGGWAEGAVQTALNAACAVIRRTGGKLLPGNPLDTMHSAYRY